MSLLNKCIQQHKELFPSFFTRDENSNFHKHVSVIARQIKDFNEQIMIVNLGQRIIRPLIIQKIQNEFYNCKLIFKVQLTNIQNVVITHEDTNNIVYEQIFEETGNNYFEYEIQVKSDIEPIPTDKYKITVTTFEGYVFTKGYPENDTKKGDDFDHDDNLDRIGLLYNIPRYKHIPVTLSEYENTIPPFHIKDTEDDYYYMNRILTYIKEYNNVPLPILELWKYYGVCSRMENRKIMIHQQNIHDMQQPPSSSENGLPIYMKTKDWYNSCAYDVYADYDDFPTNLTLPSENEITNIFMNNLPITKVNQFNISIKIKQKEYIDMRDEFQVKIGETTLYDSNPYHERDYFTITCTNLNLDTETGDLTQTNTEEDKNYIVVIDEHLQMFIIESDIQDNATLNLDTENGELQTIIE